MKYWILFLCILSFLLNLEAYPLNFSKWLLDNEIISHVIIASSDSEKSIIVLKNNIVGELNYINISIPKKQFIKRKSKTDTIHNDFRKAEFYLSEAIHPVFPIINDSVYVFKKWFSKKEEIKFSSYFFHENTEEVLKIPVSKIKSLHNLIIKNYELKNKTFKKKNQSETLLNEKMDVWDSLVTNQADLYIIEEEKYQDQKNKGKLNQRVVSYSISGFVIGCVIGIVILFII